MDNAKSYGQVAYEAYGDNREWRAYNGERMPRWDEVRQAIQIAWQVAAQAAVASYKERNREQISASDCGETLTDSD